MQSTCIEGCLHWGVFASRQTPLKILSLALASLSSLEVISKASINFEETFTRQSLHPRDNSIAKVRIFGDPFGAIFDAFLSHLDSPIFTPRNAMFSSGGICGIQKSGPQKTAQQKRIQFGDLKNLIQTVICSLENGIHQVRGSQKWLKNGPKKEHFLDIKNANLADVNILLSINKFSLCQCRNE